MSLQVLAAKEHYELVKVDLEHAQNDVLAHGRVLVKLKREEMEAAERITEDHVHACDRGASLGDIFPSIQVHDERSKSQPLFVLRLWKSITLLCTTLLAYSHRTHIL